MPRRQERERGDSPPEKPVKRVLKHMAFYEKIFRIVTFIVVPVSLLLLKDWMRFEEWKDENLTERAKPSDLWIAVVACIVIFFVRKAFEKFMYAPVFDAIEEKHQGEERIERTKRVVKWIYDFFFYGGVTIFAYAMFGDAHFIPPFLGGSGDCWTLYDYYPRLPPIHYIKEYYLIQLGSHLCSVLEQVIFKRNDSKFYEYFLHHYLAFALIFFSYMFHIWSLGTTVMITHDISDIFLSAGRAFEAQRYIKTAKKFFYAILGVIAASWAYCRTLVFPVCCIYVSATVWQTEKMQPVHLVERVFAFEFILMCVLLVMNIYWVVILSLMFASSFKKKEYTNSYDPTILNKEKAKAN